MNGIFPILDQAADMLCFGVIVARPPTEIITSLKREDPNSAKTLLSFYHVFGASLKFKLI